MKFNLEKKAPLFFSLVAVALIIVLVVFYSSNQSIKTTSDSVEHTQEVLQKSNKILLDVLNIESGSRGYVLTGNEMFLVPFNEAVETINSDLDELTRLTADNFKQQQRVDILKMAVLKKVVFVKETIELKKHHESEEAEKMISDGQGRILTEKIRSLINDINQEEFRLLKQRKSENEKSNKNSETTFLLLIVIIFIVLAIIIVILKNQKLKDKNAEKEKIASELIRAKTELGLQDERNEIKALQYARSLIEASLDPLVTISAEGKITDVNNASVKVTGVPREELIGTEFSKYFTEPEKAQDGYHQVFEKGFVSDYPLTIKHISGKLIDVLYNASVYRDDKGNVLGVFAAARDVTKQKEAIELLVTNKELVFENEEKEKRAGELLIANNELKKAEDDIRKLNDELEQKVIERTEQFQSVNKELEAFAYSISHDLRAPLRAINGFAKILQEDYQDKLDSDGMGSLNAILNNSKRMGQLIDDLLAFSRLGRKAVTTSEINMAVLVSSVKEEEMLGNSNDVEFVVHELLPALGQQSLIKQVWVNLISNAIKYSKHKTKTHIEIGSYEKDNLIVYYVKDNGAGFDMQYYEKLFGVFQRLHSQEEFEGTGIGLAIVQKIIQRHNGTVWAESKVNEGTSFYFSLPGINS